MDIDELIGDVPEGTKFCNSCSKYKSFKYFSRDKQRKDGLFLKCKECCSNKYKSNIEHNTKYRKEYYIKNKENIAAQRREHRSLNRARINSDHKRWRLENPGKFKNGLLRRTYGISLEIFHSMIQSQDGKCGICKSALDMGKKTHVDHDHNTGEIRGILCNRCNSSLWLYENHEEATKVYLKKYSKIEPDVKNYIPSSAFLH